jgi:hypothetical protein
MLYTSKFTKGEDILDTLPHHPDNHMDLKRVKRKPREGGSERWQERTKSGYRKR